MTDSSAESEGEQFDFELVAPMNKMMADDDEDLSPVGLEDILVVAFTQRGESGLLEYDVMGIESNDVAIAIATRGLFMLVLDSLGMWDDDEEMSVEIDDSDDEED